MAEAKTRARAKVRESGEAGAATTARAAAARRSRSASADALASELRELRATLDETVRQFHVRAASRLADVERAVAGSGPAGARTTRPRPKARAAMLAEVRALKVKPRKGRLKDLARIAELIEELLGHLPS
jgi:hypothetical protein